MEIITINTYNDKYFFMKQPNVGMKTYCNRNIIDFYVGHQDTITLLIIMISVNPKKITYDFPSIFLHPVYNRISVLLIQIFSGLTLTLVQDIINVIETCEFLKHVVFILELDTNNINVVLAATNLINTSIKCHVFNNEKEANTAAHMYSGQQKIQESRKKLKSILQKKIFFH